VVSVSATSRTGQAVIVDLIIMAPTTDPRRRSLWGASQELDAETKTPR
jgi:hypothetical protein